MSYQLGVDLGTTWSAAAVCRPGVAAPEPVTLGEHSHAVASAVYAGGDGSFLLGEAAERRALSDPDRVVREFKRRIGDPTPVLVGREPVPAEVLAARFIGALVGQVARREGSPPSRIAVTHPAGWGPHKVSALRSALAGHGIGPALLLSEPQAAAVGYATTAKVEPGSVVAVYDLGGGTFDAAVVRKGADGRFELLGSPEGLERLGGVDFDEAVFSHVRMVLGPAWAELDGTDPAVLAAVARLRRECTAAKEALSVDTVVHVPVMLPGLHTRVRLGRADFEDMIRPAVAETVEMMRRTIASAGVDPAEVTVLLVGGASRTPLVAELVSAGLGRPASVDVDPKGVIAAGAALVARDADGPAHTPAAAVLAAHGAGLAAAAGSAGPAEPSAAVAEAPPTTALRPSKQSRPFASARVRPGMPRTVVAVVAASVLAAAVLGGAIAFAGRPGPGAAASTPETSAPASETVQPEVVVVSEPGEPAPQLQEQDDVSAPVTGRPRASTTRRSPVVVVPTAAGTVPPAPAPDPADPGTTRPQPEPTPEPAPAPTPQPAPVPPVQPPGPTTGTSPGGGSGSSSPAAGA